MKPFDPKQAIDVLCISSTYEGTPLVLFEAMAAEKAIVSTAVDGCREILDDGVTGLLAPVGDPGKLAEGLMRVIEDRDLREGLGRSARRAVVAYDVLSAVRQIEAVYDELLATGPRREHSG